MLQAKEKFCTERRVWSFVGISCNWQEYWGFCVHASLKTSLCCLVWFASFLSTVCCQWQPYFKTTNTSPSQPPVLPQALPINLQTLSPFCCFAKYQSVQRLSCGLSDGVVGVWIPADFSKPSRSTVRKSSLCSGYRRFLCPRLEHPGRNDDPSTYSIKAKNVWI